MDRRQFLATVAVSPSLLQPALSEEKKPAEMTLGFSTYGMKKTKTENAIRAVAEIGYDAVEMTVWPGWDAEPSNMSSSRRATVRRLLKEHDVKLTSLMEHIYPSASDAENAKHLQRLTNVFELANDLSTDFPPVVQTVLGGGSFQHKKNLFVDRVGSWIDVGKEYGVVTCIKPHRGGALSQPSEAIEIFRQLGETKWCRMVYDYSHYIFRDIPFVESIRQSLPYIGHVAVKDAVRKGERTAFVLPGEAGTIDFVTLLSELARGRYSGDISCEVSGMVWSKPGYDSVKAAKTCYRNLSKAFENAKVDRV